jgi:hypothetical protein
MGKPPSKVNHRRWLLFSLLAQPRSSSPAPAIGQRGIPTWIGSRTDRDGKAGLIGRRKPSWAALSSPPKTKNNGPIPGAIHGFVVLARAGPSKAPGRARFGSDAGTATDTSGPDAGG